MYYDKYTRILNFCGDTVFTARTKENYPLVPYFEILYFDGILSKLTSDQLPLFFTRRDYDEYERAILQRAAENPEEFTLHAQGRF